jgi:hypothetical protein
MQCELLINMYLKIAFALFGSALLAVVSVQDARSPIDTSYALSARQEWGPVSGGLRMAISSIISGNLPREHTAFYVAIQNVGDADIVLNLGQMLANGKVMFPKAIRLTLTDAQGKTRELHFSDKRYPVVAGRVDDFTVALRSGSIYALRVSLDQYWSPETKEYVLTLSDGRYRISARLEGQGAKSVNIDMQGIALMNFWKGTVQSNSFEFEVRESGVPK